MPSTRTAGEREQHEICLVGGVEGDSIYLNDYRIAGPKPWGGGPVKKRWKISLEDIETAVGLKFHPAKPSGRKGR